MKSWFKNISLFKIITGMFIGFLLLALTNYLVIKSYVDGMATDAMEIDVAGKTRMLSQKILRLTDKAVYDVSTKKELQELLIEHDNIFNVFKSGGIVTYNGQLIEPIIGAERLVLNQSIQLWDSVHMAVNSLLNYSAEDFQSNPKAAELSNFLNSNAENLLNSNSRFVEVLEQRYYERLNSLYTILIGFLLFNSICIVIVLYATKRFIFVPLANVADTAKKLASGEVGINLDYSNNNELGKITDGLNHLSSNLEKSRQFIARIEKGELSEEQDSFDHEALEKDSIETALLKMRDQMKFRAQEDETRSWTTQGLAKFVDILRANHNLQELGDAILSNLTEYTNSNQAGLYLLNDHEESNKHLELTSLYAFNTKKFDTKSYRLGEGLVGQTFLEKKTIYFLEVPDDYISITSGLGEANPKSLLLVPLKVENEVYGVLEMASFNEYEEYQIAFIEKLSENIASTIASVKTNERTKVLLEESQQLTEQMQAQEEEMRQNMEELTATQEEMARKESAVNAQLEAINAALGIAEYSIDGYVLSSNRKFNEALGFTEQSIMEASFHKLHGNTNIIEEIQQSRQWSGWLEKLKSNGEAIELKSHFIVASDEHGESNKIIEIVSQFKKEVENTPENSDRLGLELQQHLDALDITQEQLTSKLSHLDVVLNQLKELVNTIIYTEQGVIEDVSSKLTLVIGKVNKIDELVDLPLSQLTQSSNNLSVTTLNDKIGTIRVNIVQLGDNNYMMIWA